MATATVTTKQHGAYNKLSRTKQGFSAVDYAMNPNPHNTDHGQVTDRVLATSYGNCTKDVKDQWNIVWSRAGTKRKNLNEVQRQIQSFSNDLNYHSKHDIQLANNIGYQTGWYLYGQHGFQFMVVTQADGRSHLLHNHILVNETNPITHKQLRGNPTSISYVRNISDRVLQYYGLSTMDQTPYLSPDHKVMAEVRLNDQKKYIWKQDLKNRIDRVASQSTSWGQFINDSYNQYGVTIDPYKRHKDKRTGKKVITKDAHGNPKFKKHISYYFKGQDNKYHTARDHRLGTNYGINHLNLTIRRNHALEIDRKRKQSLASSNVISDAQNITKSATLINHSQSSYSINSSAQTVKNEPNPTESSVLNTNYSAIDSEKVDHVKSTLSSANQYEKNHNLTGAQRSNSIKNTDYLSPIMFKSPSNSNVDISTTSHSPTKNVDQNKVINNQKQQNNNYYNIINNKKNSAKRKDQQLLEKYANPYLARFSKREQLSIIKDIYVKSDQAIKHNEHQLKLDATKRPAIVKRNDQIDKARKSRHATIDEIKRRVSAINQETDQSIKQSKRNNQELQNGSKQEDQTIQETERSNQKIRRANQEDPSRLQEFIHKSLQACQAYYEEFERKVYRGIHQAVHIAKAKERKWQKDFKHQQLIRKEHQRNSLSSEIKSMINNDIGGATQNDRQERSNDQQRYQSYASSMNVKSKSIANSTSESVDNKSALNLSEESTIPTGSPMGFEDSMEAMNRSIENAEDPNYHASFSRSSVTSSSAPTSEGSKVKSSSSVATPNVHQIINNHNNDYKEKLTAKKKKILQLRKQRHGFRR